MGFLIYLLSVVDGIKSSLCGVAVGLIICGLVGWLVIGIMSLIEEWEEDNEWKKWKKMFKKFQQVTIVGVVIAFTTVFIPSSKVLVAIYMIPKMANSETAETLSKLPNKAAQVLEKKLNEYLEENLETKKE